VSESVPEQPGKWRAILPVILGAAIFIAIAFAAVTVAEQVVYHFWGPKRIRFSITAASMSFVLVARHLHWPLRLRDVALLTGGVAALSFLLTLMHYFSAEDRSPPLLPYWLLTFGVWVIVGSSGLWLYRWFPNPAPSSQRDEPAR
jgi:hypothetical protein